MVGQVELSKLVKWHNEFGAGVILAPGSTFAPTDKVEATGKLSLV